MAVIPERLTQTIEIPEGVQLEIDAHIFKFKGPKGEVQRKLITPTLKITKQDNKLTLQPTTKKPTKREKRIINTFKSHINNLIKGVQEEFIYKLKICSGHFPMTVTTDNKTLTIKNFLGEKTPRTAKIIEGVTIKIDGEIITVEGKDIEKVGQTAANIEKSTRITNKDRRKFQDGIYITSKAGKQI